MHFGDIVRNLLEENDITQRQLAERLNIAVSTLGNYIRNVREPDFETLKKFAAFFQVSTDYLLDYHPISDAASGEEELLRVYRAADAGAAGAVYRAGQAAPPDEPEKRREEVVRVWYSRLK